ncbi:hypothetical protein D4764_01G0017910 [Takifugu flavidus]|uniref:Uncharacterized protein n=1 Tax=Takifugu flavidus TaxID=433684 RepID=A0A5C6PSM4_9TELE|nr:hypothetical protein D4764_01G0017910 [Takifugu flavidus]
MLSGVSHYPGSPPPPRCVTVENFFLRCVGMDRAMARELLEQSG